MNSATAAHARAWTGLITSRSGRRRAVVAAVTAGVLLAGVLDGPGAVLAGVKPAVKALKVTTTTLPGGTGGKVYSAKLAATGGIKPYTWSVTQGSLPAGLTLVPATGLINGVPTSSGTSDFTVAVTDSENPSVTATAAESIAVNVPALVITTTSLPQATAGASYSAKLTATGGIKPYTWSVTSGPLPAGLKLAAATGVISGTPTTSGNFTVGVSVTDGESPPVSTQGTVSLSIGVAPLVVTTGGTLPTATTGAPYSVHLNAAGGIKPYTWSVGSGSLPPGLKLSQAGVISGTPKTDGTTTFTVQVADAENPAVTATATESITVADQLAVTTTSLPGGTADQPYTATLNAVGGVTPYTWSVSSGSLPDGLSLDPATGTISGTPAGTGTAAFTVAVTDAGNPPVAATASLTIAVTALPLAVATSSLQTGIQGRFYDDRLTATGGVTPYTWSVSSGSLPAGLSLDPESGTINGTPTGTGTSAFTVQVTDSDSPAASASASLTITVGPPLAVTTTSLPTAIVGQPYMQTLTAVGGISPYTWSIVSGSLPGGLTLDPSTGIISGTATGTGHVLLAVQVTDSGNPQSSAQMHLPFNAATSLEMTTSSLPNAIQGRAYEQQLGASGGVMPYKWSISSGSLPAGLTLDPESGIISGTPTALGAPSFTVQLTDSSTPALQVSTTLSITVAGLLTVTTRSLPGGEVGQPYSAQLSGSGGIEPYTWSVVGSGLPGLQLDSSTGELTGTPTSPGQNLLVQLTDAENPPQTTMVNVNITVAPALTIGAQFIPNGEVGASYQGDVTAQLGVKPYTYSIVSGGLPAGLFQDPNTGLISGTPEQSGDFPFTVQVTDSNDPAATVTASEVMIIQPQVQILTPGLPPAIQGEPYSFQLAATGGYTPYTWSPAALPDGLGLTPGGLIVGVPAEPGGFPLPVTVTDSNSPPVQATAILTLTVIPMPQDMARRAGQTAMHSVWGRLRG